MDTRQLKRLKLRAGESDEELLCDLLEAAENIIKARRYPCSPWPETLESRYADLQVRIALDLYNKQGAEGETAHSENGVSRTYGAENVSKDLLSEIIPKAGVIKHERS
ncbi:phage head-tail connector protein [Ruminococcus sp. Marseille-P6503]|uniref:phage head-tail connector protein n=1 Tax=Ruminococcus sp. Marseille-P6503 TaxID=2364796 RepID=UPI000F546010|nr:phage head-tail connector protein [Ruminococcus sp. Marseille-P6503]